MDFDAVGEAEFTLLRKWRWKNLACLLDAFSGLGKGLGRKGPTASCLHQATYGILTYIPHIVPLLMR